MALEYCQNCGSRISVDSRSCVKCGDKQTSAGASAPQHPRKTEIQIKFQLKKKWLLLGFALAALALSAFLITNMNVQPTEPKSHETVSDFDGKPASYLAEKLLEIGVCKTMESRPSEDGTDSRALYDGDIYRACRDENDGFVEIYGQRSEAGISFELQSFKLGMNSSVNHADWLIWLPRGANDSPNPNVERLVKLYGGTGRD